MEYKDYYQVLGVPRTADEKEIKRSFRKLAQQYHPDKNPGDKGAEQKFKEINEAYTVLSDADKRSKYDRFGAQWEQYTRSGGRPEDFNWGGSGGPGGGFGGAGGGTRTMSPEEFEQLFGNSGFSSFFESLFGGDARGGGGMGGARRYSTGGSAGAGFNPYGAAPAREQEVPIKVTLEEAFHGTTRTLESADGTRLQANIPRGVRTGSKVRMKGGGQGNIILKVEVTTNSQFEREEDNLRVELPVDLYSALLGGEVQVPTLERPVVLTIPPGTQNGRVFRLRGLGMPQLKQPDQRGDLLAVVAVKLPTNLSAEEKALIEQLRALRSAA